MRNIKRLRVFQKLQGSSIAIMRYRKIFRVELTQTLSGRSTVASQGALVWDRHERHAMRARNTSVSPNFGPRRGPLGY